MKISFKTMINKADPKTLESFFADVNQEKVPKATFTRIQSSVLKQNKPKHTKFYCKRWASVLPIAACFVIVIGIGFGIYNHLVHTPVISSTSESSNQAENQNVMDVNAPSGGNVYERPSEDLISVEAPSYEIAELPSISPKDKTEPIAEGWFETRSLDIATLYYANEIQNIETFSPINLGASLIMVKTFDEHKDCKEVYYNPDTDEIFCFEDEFLKASGMTRRNNQYIFFEHDVFKSNISVVMVAESLGITNTSIWIFDSENKTVQMLDLPKGVTRYKDIDIFSDSVRNGKICVSVNSEDVGHFICLYDIQTNKYTKIIESDSDWIQARFLSDELIELSEDDNYSFYNIETGKMVKVIGEYNYYHNGKVFSVKNNGPLNHKDVRVAAYDARTGEKIENENVLVRTILDDGTRAVLTKNVTTGEETIILTDYTQNCYTWSKDYGYFYVYSASNHKVACYSVEDDSWFFLDVDNIELEQMVIEGVEYIAFNNYSIAVSDDNSHVKLYYNRELFELHPIPEFEDERVDSVYWDDYRGFKEMNFPNATYFGFFNQDTMRVDIGLGVCVNDMTALRNIIIYCLENKGEKLINRYVEEDEWKKLTYLISCGTMRILFWSKNDVNYMCMICNGPKPYTSTDAVYEVPKRVFDYIEESSSDFLKNSW